MKEQPITTLKGIGEKTAALFAKLDIYTVEDLLHEYPKGYDSYEKPVSVGQVTEAPVIAVEVILPREPDLLQFGKIPTVSVLVKEGGVALQLVWYHMPYVRSYLKARGHYIVRGRVVKKRSRLTMEQPEIFLPYAYQAVMDSMQPIYRQTKGLGNKMMIKTMHLALEKLEEQEQKEEVLPKSLLKKYQLFEYHQAIEQIHFPKSREELLTARRRLVFEEFFFFLLAVRLLKEKRMDKESPYCILCSEEAKRLEQSLPYALTKAQQKAIEEIRGDMSGGLVMNRLVQGDVGSGKTILAVLALLETACAGYQGALMAPTEVLAKQHFESIQELFLTHGIQKELVLVTGSMTAKEKRIAYEKIASHKADIIIGTHALIQEKVEYDNLALVVIDEQHRFGVEQREQLGNKGKLPHVLVMSATPIPRTLAIILYGDLDISVIDELPKGRQAIKNCVVGIEYRKKAYHFLEQELDAGHQVYVICPMVESSEMIEAENVLDYTKQLRKELSTSVCVECLHGRMKGKEKNRIMERFAAGEIQVLVSTTVIEVGVNVPNATVMMIENAERFGLAQLHQLRGRVGRGKAQSYCIMVTTSKDEATRKRLDILNRSNDGFYIASEDLKLRGPGDLFGLKQSGELEFQIADIFTDANLLKQVSEEVDTLLRKDGELVRHKELKKELDSYLKMRYDRLCL